MRNATLVVIEFGGSWPRWLSPTGRGDMAVVAQHYEGEPGSLVTQVASRVSRLAARGWSITDIVLVGNGRSDAAASAARAVLVRGLLANLGASGGGRLVLTTTERSAARAQQSLTILAATLDRDAIGSGVAVSVRLGDGTPIEGLSARACA
ncbi:MAG: hypothetical protein OZ921_16505 [Sorangiineae bacterium]|nr:hypothetical protein [Polyangiaceae bacterium]MEB2324116.1 hypothetical protein [Sorangiineae bacterium]